MASGKSIYLAGPLGFSEAGRHFHAETVVPSIRGWGYKVLDPWALTDQAKVDEVRGMAYGTERREAWRALNAEIGEANRQAIDRCDGIVAVLDGPDVDSGTAAEIGYGYAVGKTILVYRGDFRQGADNEGGVVNLQVEYFIRASGGTIVTEFRQLQGQMRRAFGS